jgi:hypothetical protein
VHPPAIRKDNSRPANLKRIRKNYLNLSPNALPNRSAPNLEKSQIVCCLTLRLLDGCAEHSLTPTRRMAERKAFRQKMVVKSKERVT